MFEKTGLTRMAQSLAAHSGNRLAVIARNVANADTPHYRAQDLQDFGTLVGAGRELPLRLTRAKHLSSPSTPSAAPAVAAPDSMAPNGNDVSLDIQMMKSVQTRQSQEMALAVYRSSAQILRSSLGRQ